jgi:hypothetical protein
LRFGRLSLVWHRMTIACSPFAATNPFQIE